MTRRSGGTSFTFWMHIGRALTRLGGLCILDPQNLDAGRRGQYFAEGVHPVAGLLRRADAAAAELVELIEVRQFDLELQRRSLSMAARQRHQHPGIEAVGAAASTSRRMKSIARWRFTG